ncbi:hypothetical protein [Helicobacter canis]|uniref:hypothetical protein n=1 Tax=Helicobacter canis TaxID=29419 RepID=UPI0011C0534E|nr:hypothetical protein [Helicobacter canis]
MAFLRKARTPSSLTFPKNAKATTAPPQLLESGFTKQAQPLESTFEKTAELQKVDSREKWILATPLLALSLRALCRKV